MTSQLALQEVSVSYGDFRAVEGVSLTLEEGQIGCLLGPSGCGKTTLLRAIAGFEPVAGGSIALRGQMISGSGVQLPPEQRRVGMVFQDFALFPHLNVGRNVGFGLSGESRGKREQRVEAMLELVGLSEYARAWPHELSGGQQQRVALARALAPAPQILLLDEPFSSLDTELREQLAGEVRELLKANGVTAILVTHDQHEAFAMADRIALLRQGRVAQLDTPYNLYHNPASEFVAEFIGQGNVVSVAVKVNGDESGGAGSLQVGDLEVGRIAAGASDWQAGQRLRLLLRPDDIEYDEGSHLHLPVSGRAFRGAHYLYELRLPDGQRAPCLAPSHVDVAPGGQLPICFNLKHVVVFGADTGAG